MRAHEAALAASDSTVRRPSLPLFQWVAHQELKRLRGDFDAGDGIALMLAIRKCANHDLLMPEWVAAEYIKRFDLILNYEAASWDDVLGRPVPKGMHLDSLKKRRELKFKVYEAVLERTGPTLNPTDRPPVDDGLFEAVGKELGIGKTLANEYYYAAKALIEK